MSIICLPRGGQYSYKGHVINFPQNVQGFISNLPRRVDQLDILVLKKNSDNTDLPPHLFTANRQRVTSALTWLQRNNRYYTDITIEQDRLDALLIDGILHLNAANIAHEGEDEHHQQICNNTNSTQPFTSSQTAIVRSLIFTCDQDQHCHTNNNIPQTFAPAQMCGPNEREAIRAAADN